MRIYGVIGYPLEHSYSPDFFTDKFKEGKIEGVKYELFPLKDISELPELLIKFPGIHGLNVTIPYKKSIIKYLDIIDPEAEKCGAVNTIRIDNSSSKSKLTGYNTDIFGFKISLEEIINQKPVKALVLGSGGASKAVKYVLNEMGILHKIISRNPSGIHEMSYDQISPDIIKNYSLIINTTPLGMFPNTSKYPQIPYEALCSDNILYDLIYNPTETKFLKIGKEYGAKTYNGKRMFILQAERSWEIWNK